MYITLSQWGAGVGISTDPPSTLQLKDDLLGLRCFDYFIDEAAKGKKLWKQTQSWTFSLWSNQQINVNKLIDLLFWGNSSYSRCAARSSDKAILWLNPPTKLSKARVDVNQSPQSGPAAQSEQTGINGEEGLKETRAKTKHFRQRLNRGAAAIDGTRKDCVLKTKACKD